MARSVDEGQQLPAPLNLVGADVLGNAAGLARDDIRVADPVEQQRLSVVDVTHDSDDGRPYLVVLLVLLVVVVAEELGPKSRLLLLARVDQSDLGADLGREQGDHVVGEGLSSRDHLTLEEKETDYVARGSVEARAELLGRRSPLDDYLMVRNRGARGQVGRDLDRLELFHVAAPPTRSALWRTAASDRTTSGGTGRAAGGVTAATDSRRAASASERPTSGGTSAVAGGEVASRTLKTCAAAGSRSDRAPSRRPGADRAGARRAHTGATTRRTGTRPRAAWRQGTPGTGRRRDRATGDRPGRARRRRDRLARGADRARRGRAVISVGRDRWNGSGRDRSGC